MDAVTLVRQALLYAHLIAFAVALAEIIRADWRVLWAVPDPAALHRTARLVAWTLLGLWVTGLGLTGLDTGFDPAIIAAKPKLLTKLVVVVALSGNGVLLHRIAFPLLGSSAPRRPAVTILIAALGAVSTVSWFFAAFVGVARLIAGSMTLGGFLALYATALAGGVLLAALVVAPMLRTRLAAARPIRRAPDEAQWLADDEPTPATRPEPRRAAAAR
jgi:hypothetical protein